MSSEASDRKSRSDNPIEDLVEVGINTFRKNNYKDGLEIFDKVLKRDDRNDTVWLYRGLSLYGIRKFPIALESFNRALEINSENLQAIYHAGLTLSELGQKEKAIEYYDKAIRLDPNYADAYYQKGNALSDLQQFEKAIEYYDKALKIDPKFAFALESKTRLQESMLQKDKELSDSTKQSGVPQKKYGKEISSGPVNGVHSQEIGPTQSVEPEEFNKFAGIVLVTGSRKIRNNYKEISNLSKLIGSRIMDEPDWILLNGGATEISSNRSVISVDHLACIGAKEKLEKSGNLKSEKTRILTMVPHVDGQNHGIGKIEIEGETARERRLNLVKKADAIIAIEGSIGTADIIKHAMELKKPVLPIPCTGEESQKKWYNNEDGILQKFDLKKTSEGYKLLTVDGLGKPEELSELMIRLIRRKVTEAITARSWHDTPIHADNPSIEDLLGRKPFAKAIASGMRYYLENAGNTGSFLVHIYGPWGREKAHY